MSHTIPATSITIDGPRAWWVRDPGVCDLCERFPSGHVAIDDCGPGHLDRPCETCNGVGHLGPATYATPQNYGRACPDCDGTGRFTWEIAVNVPCVGGRIDLCDHTACGTRQITVHVVRVMPIVRFRIEVPQPRILKMSAPKMGGQSHWIDDGERPGKMIRLPADAEPGEVVIELAVHT
jgi:hypothetical protein